MFLKLLANFGAFLYFVWYLEAIGLELLDLPEQGDQLVAVQHIKLAVFMIQLHEFAVCFQTVINKIKNKKI